MYLAAVRLRNLRLDQSWSSNGNAAWTHWIPAIMSAWTRRAICGLSFLSLVYVCPALAGEAPTKLKLSLDWSFGASTSNYSLAKERGYFADEGLDVSLDSGKGGAEFIQRLLSGAYDIGVGDMTSYIQYLGTNPNDDSMRAVYVTVNQSPYAILSLTKKGIQKPTDLVGKKIASGAFAATKAVWPAFANANGLAEDSVTFQLVDPAVRGALMLQGSVDAVAGFVTDVPIFKNLGLTDSQINLMNYADHGVSFYASAVFVRRPFYEQNPKLVEAFLRAVNRGLQATVADPEAAIAAVKKESALTQENVERPILAALVPLIVTSETRKNGLGSIEPSRLTQQVDALVLAMKLPSKPGLDRLYTGDFLPPLADRLPK